MIKPLIPLPPLPRRVERALSPCPYHDARRRGFFCLRSLSNKRAGSTTVECPRPALHAGGGGVRHAPARSRQAGALEAKAVSGVVHPGACKEPGLNPGRQHLLDSICDAIYLNRLPGSDSDVPTGECVLGTEKPRHFFANNYGGDVYAYPEEIRVAKSNDLGELKAAGARYRKAGALQAREYDARHRRPLPLQLTKAVPVAGTSNLAQGTVDVYG